ncbi:MAG: hypothetical protein WDM84_07165 [Bauldia sp.]
MNAFWTAARSLHKYSANTWLTLYCRHRGPLEKMTLSEYLAFLQANQMPFPAELTAAVAHYERLRADGETHVVKLNESSTTRVETTLLKLVRGLLVAYFGWDPDAEEYAERPFPQADSRGHHGQRHSNQRGHGPQMDERGGSDHAQPRFN